MDRGSFSRDNRVSVVLLLSWALLRTFALSILIDSDLFFEELLLVFLRLEPNQAIAADHIVEVVTAILLFRSLYIYETEGVLLLALEDTGPYHLQRHQVFVRSQGRHVLLKLCKTTAVATLPHRSHLLESLLDQRVLVETIVGGLRHTHSTEGRSLSFDTLRLPRVLLNA